jgi:hypothetical protein
MVQKELWNFLKWFLKGFWKWYDGGGENGLTQNGFWSCNVFLLSKYWLPLFIWRDYLSISFSFFSFFFLFLSLFSMLCLFENSGIFMIIEGEITSSKTFFFKWLQYTGGGRIFWNGVMHANMAKPWLWIWGSCVYIGGGRIFRSGGMNANISSLG